MILLWLSVWTVADLATFAIAVTVRPALAVAEVGPIGVVYLAHGLVAAALWKLGWVAVFVGSILIARPRHPIFAAILLVMALTISTVGTVANIAALVT